MANLAGRAAFAEQTNVSRETMEDFDIFVDLLQKWAPKINLVSLSTLADVWTRHMLDSAQLFGLVETKSNHWVDIGTGGGFPGVVVSIIAKRLSPDTRFTFVDSDIRKTVFLQTVIRELSLPATVIANRIEDIDPLAADILSARALAPLKTLLKHCNRHLSPGGQALLMKGASFRAEIDEALEFWTFQRDECTSITDSSSAILRLGDIKSV